MGGFIEPAKLAVAGDGQVTLNDTVLKHRAVKVRKIYHDKIVVGFAGATADALNLFDRFEAKLEQYNGNLTRSAVELAKDWRTDKYLRRLEALMVTADKDNIYLISGNGDVIEPEHDLMAIGSGGPFAQAAALALLRNTELDATAVVEQALAIAGEICVYTNQNIVVETLKASGD